MHILYKGEYSCYLGKEKNVKGCFPCEQYSVVHVSHGTIGISRASTIKRIQNILGKVEWYLHRNNGFKGIFSKLYNYNDHLSRRTSKFFIYVSRLTIWLSRTVGLHLMSSPAQVYVMVLCLSRVHPCVIFFKTTSSPKLQVQFWWNSQMFMGWPFSHLFKLCPWGQILSRPGGQ
jgi:hypothetical protein